MSYLEDTDYDHKVNLARINGAQFASTHYYSETPLSGEWAADKTCQDVVSELGYDPYELDESGFNALCASWEEGYFGWWDSIWNDGCGEVN